jgi:hypothetical protein
MQSGFTCIVGLRAEWVYEQSGFTSRVGLRAEWVYEQSGFTSRVVYLLRGGQMKPLAAPSDVPFQALAKGAKTITLHWRVMVLEGLQGDSNTRRCMRKNLPLFRSKKSAK